MANSNFRVRQSSEIEEKASKFRTNASDLKFPALLEAVNAELIEPLTFSTEFRSLQKTRNCLEHRNGVVGAQDIDAGTGNLVLCFPRSRLFYKRGNEKIELIPGETVDPGVSENMSSDDTRVMIYHDLIPRIREYAVGDQIIITESDFTEIAMACHVFASDVISKLPIPPAAIKN